MGREDANNQAEGEAGPVTQYSFCETVAATGPWHIRMLSEIGHKYNGGADTKTLCGLKAAWDVQHEFEGKLIESDGRLRTTTCASCLTIYMKNRTSE